MNWIVEHWGEVMAILLVILRLAESVAALTPSDADNKAIAAIKEFFHFG